MDTEDIKVSEEEIAEETEAQAEIEETKIRESVVADLGIEDNDANKDLIEKMVARETDHRTKLSKAVGQKIKYRDLAGGKKPAEKKPAEKSAKVDDPVEAARLATEETLMNRDLEDLEYSDELKDEIKELAQRKGISIRKAEKDSYIQFKIGEETRQKQVDDAAKNGSGKSKSGVAVDTSKPLDPADYDMSTEEGRAEWAEAKKAKAEARTA